VCHPTGYFDGNSESFIQFVPAALLTEQIAKQSLLTVCGHRAVL
jgi:hypothetical protein